MKTFELKYEPIDKDGKIIPKWNIYYYDENGGLENYENYSCNGIVNDDTIKKGYTLIY